MQVGRLRASIFYCTESAVYSIATSTTLSHTCRMRELGLIMQRDAFRSCFRWVRISSTSWLAFCAATFEFEAAWPFVRRNARELSNRPFVRKLPSLRITEEALIPPFIFNEDPTTGACDVVGVKLAAAGAAQRTYRVDQLNTSGGVDIW